MLTLGSLFDGIGGWQLAAQHAGVEPIWSSEIEPFPCAVTAKHFPKTVQLGDITKLDGAKLPPVDIICAGSPCQDLSVAGKQEGLKGARSGLFLRAVDIVRRMRFATGGQYPRFFVWENVPGAFSSNRGMDFQAVLEEIGESAVPMPEGNRWAPAGLVQFPGAEIAWRVLDAQYWGVPQRRKRIFLVADFRGHSAGEILFERESVPRDSSTGRETRERAAAGTESGVGDASGGCLTPWDSQGNRIISSDGVAQTLRTHESGGNWAGNVYVPDKARSLTARADGSPCVDRGPEVVATFQNTGRGWWNKSPIAQTLRTPCGGDSTKANLIAAGFKVGNSEAAHSIGYAVETSPTLSAMDSGNKPAVAVYDMTHADEVMRPVEGGKCQTLNARMGTGGNQVPVVSYAIAGNIIGREDQNGGHHMGVDKDVSFTLNTVDRHAVCVGNGQLHQGVSDKAGALNCMHDQQAVMVAAVDCRNGRETPESGTLQSKSSGGYSLNYQNPVRVQSTVRRLTPLECERLQGLPDGYTLIDDKSCSDSARYKALGNGMAQPCADYVIRRITEVCNVGEKETDGGAD